MLRRLLYNFIKVKINIIFFPVILVAISNYGFAQQSEGIAPKNNRYLSYLPANYSFSTYKYPLLIFLHGKGERGDDINLVKRHGPPQMIENDKWPLNNKFIVISPQLPLKYQYWPVKVVDGLIEHIIKTYRIDEDRIYLTGISMGGIGTWNYASAYPEKLAAILPICGKGDFKKACNLKDLPVWAFHGENDKAIPSSGSINMFKAIKTCKSGLPDNPIHKLTLYPGVGHDSWTMTYNNFEIYEWLLSQRNDRLSKKVNYPILSNKSERCSPENIEFSTVGDLPVALSESSGLEIDKDLLLWSHNDSHNKPVLYQLDTTGLIIQIKKINNATNYDWEDLTRDEKGNFYIGDFGNNLNDRRTLQIYKIPNPANIENERVTAEVISFSFPDQYEFPPPEASKNFDIEAMLSFNDSLYLFTKNRTVPFNGYIKMYRLPNSPGNYFAEPIDSIKLGTISMLNDWITSADISPDKKKLVLLCHDKLYIFHCFTGPDFFSGKVKQINLPGFSQKEAVVFINNEELYITDESNIVGGKLYHLSINSLSGHNCTH